MNQAALISLSRQSDLLRERIAELESLVRRLSGDDMADLAKRYLGLSPYEARVLGLLIRRGTADHGLLGEVVYGDEERPDDEPNAIRAVVKRLRRKIRPLGVDLTTEYGIGFSMADGARARARELLLEGDGHEIVPDSLRRRQGDRVHRPAAL